MGSRIQVAKSGFTSTRHDMVHSDITDSDEACTDRPQNASDTSDLADKLTSTHELNGNLLLGIRLPLSQTLLGLLDIAFVIDKPPLLTR